MRDDLADLTEGTDLTAQTTGSVPQGLDSQESGEQALAIVGIATIVLIVALLAIIFRSVIICLMPIVVVTIVSLVATGLIGWANEIFDLKADSSIETILVVVLYGIGTDYILFFLFRYRERLRQGEDTKASVVHALERAGEAIASAGGAVIVAFLALLLSSLGIFKAIGPALAIAVAVTLLAALTLVPAVVTVLGRALFWPSKKWRDEPKAARFAKIGRLPRPPPGRLRRRVRPDPGGARRLRVQLQPVVRLQLEPARRRRVDRGAGDLPGPLRRRRERADPGDRAVRRRHARPGRRSRPSAPSSRRPTASRRSTPPPCPRTARPPSSASCSTATRSPTQALNDVKGPIRDAAHAAAPDGTEAYVGGTPGIFADLQAAMVRDYKVVFPVAALVIMLILALLLRSLVAPLYLMAAVGLGFAATLGATVIVFQYIGGDERPDLHAADLHLPVRDSARHRLQHPDDRAAARGGPRGPEPRPAAAEAVKHAGPTIAAAGVILAGTFASLMLSGNSLMMSMGFALSFGIFIAAFVMAMFFTPALTALIGHAAWWPGHGDEQAPKELSEVPSDQRRWSPVARSRPGGRARTASGRGRPSRRRARRPSRRCRCTGRGAAPAPGCPARRRAPRPSRGAGSSRRRRRRSGCPRCPR